MTSRLLADENVEAVTERRLASAIEGGVAGHCDPEMAERVHERHPTDPERVR